MHLMALGMFLFEIGTLPFQELKRKSDWKHATTGRVGARDAAQYVGPGTETIGLSGTVYTEISKGGVSLDDLRDMADQGEAWPLVDGTGTVFGDYVIEAIDETRRAMLADGTPLKIEFSIDLLRVGDDAPDAGAETA